MTGFTLSLLLLYCCLDNFSYVKSKHFNRNPQDLDFCLRFPHKHFATGSSWFCRFVTLTKESWLVWKQLVWAVLHTSLCYWQCTFVACKISVMWPYLKPWTRDTQISNDCRSSAFISELIWTRATGFHRHNIRHNTKPLILPMLLCSSVSVPVKRVHPQVHSPCRTEPSL